MSNKQTQTTERHFDIVQHIDTGRLFLAEFSAASGEWYELGTGRTYPMCGVRLIGPVAGELVKEAEKKATEWAHRGLDNEGCNITQDEVENTLCEYFSRGFDAARNMITAEIAEMARRLVVENVKDTILYGHGSVTKEDVRSGLEKICAGNGAQKAAQAAEHPLPAIKGWVARDKCGELYFFKEKPIRGEKMWNTEDFCAFMPFPQGNLPALRWEDEPREVEIIIKQMEAVREAVKTCGK